MTGFLGTCYKVEKLAAAIYERLAREDSYPPAMCEVFRQLGKEEHTHAEQIDMVMHAPEATRDALAAVAGKVVVEALQSAQDMADSLERGRLSEEEALRLAVRMEKQFAVLHVRSAVHFPDPRVAALFEKLGKEDQAHIDRLRDYLKRWQDERGSEAGPR